MKPILFSTPMVNALLDGTKTMTRRIVKFAAGFSPNWSGYVSDVGVIYGSNNISVARSKYQVGDVLWVRETWQRNNLWYAENDQDGYMCVVYKADGKTENVFLKKDRFEHQYNSMSESEPEWHPSIFMPKEAARILLRVTEVRAERVQNILCGDMQREGCVPATVTGGQYQQWQRDYWIPLWDSINKKRGYGWTVNPWVWVYGLEKISKDEALKGENS